METEMRGIAMEENTWKQQEEEERDRPECRICLEPIRTLANIDSCKHSFCIFINCYFFLFYLHSLLSFKK